MAKRSKNGFTLLELMMTMVIVAILAAIALPNFFDLSIDAKNASVKGSLGGLRSAISVSKVAIALKEAQGVPIYPTYAEVQANAFNASHPVLTGQTIFNPSAGIPNNPWTPTTDPPATRNKIFDCSAFSKGALLTLPNNNQGWCYNANTGEIWANSNLNGGGAGATENTY